MIHANQIINFIHTSNNLLTTEQFQTQHNAVILCSGWGWARFNVPPNTLFCVQI